MNINMPCTLEKMLQTVISKYLHKTSNDKAMHESVHERYIEPLNISFISHVGWAVLGLWQMDRAVLVGFVFWKHVCNYAVRASTMITRQRFICSLLFFFIFRPCCFINDYRLMAVTERER